MEELLKNKYTIISSNGQYITAYGGGKAYLLGSYQCQHVTFNYIKDARAMLKNLLDSGEFSWVNLHILRIDYNLVF